MGLFGAAHGWLGGARGSKKASLPKVFYTYPAIIKLSTIIPNLKKIQKTYKSRDTALKFSRHQYFFTGNQ